MSVSRTIQEELRGWASQISAGDGIDATDDFSLEVDLRKSADRIDTLEKALNAAAGYLHNAKIDLETGTKKAGIVTIDGGLKIINAALTSKTEGGK